LSLRRFTGNVLTAAGTLNESRTKFCVHTLRSKSEKGKGKFHPRTGYKVPEEEYRHSSTLSLTSALEWFEHSVPGPGRFTPLKETPGDRPIQCQKVLILSFTGIDIQNVNTEDIFMMSIIYYQYDTVSSET
jgi:hypothetical protein